MSKPKPVCGIGHLGIAVPDLDDAKPPGDKTKQSDGPFAAPRAVAFPTR